MGSVGTFGRGVGVAFGAVKLPYRNVGSDFRFVGLFVGDGNF